MQTSTAIRSLLSSVVLSILMCNAIGGNEKVVLKPAETESSMLPAAKSQVYILTQVLGIPKEDPDSSTMIVDVKTALDNGFKGIGQKDRVAIEPKKDYYDPELSRDKSHDVVSISERKWEYEIHLTCPAQPPPLPDIPCAGDLDRRICRKQVLRLIARAITAHDLAYHRRPR